MTPTVRRMLSAVALAGLALVAAGAGPLSSLRLLTGSGGDDPTSALVGATGIAAWVLALWLLLATAVTAGGHLPGRTGRAAGRASRRIAPLAVRRAVEVALGLAVTGAVLGPGPAAASSPSHPLDTSARGAVSLDWGSAPAPAPAPAPAAAPVRAAETGSSSVVVAPGDSLWALAERDLAERSTTPPSDAAVAQAWPAWWAANREVVGPDPHLLLPGTSLTPPTHA